MNVYTSKINQFFTAFILLFLLNGCGTTVTRIDSDSVTDSSSSWNDTDSRLVAEEMIQDVLSQSWLRKFKSSRGKSPAVVVGAVRDLSNEHINTRTFIADMERELINSGEVEASDEKRKTMGQEVDADYMMQGSINSIVDAISGEQTRFYQVDLTLVELGTNRKVWVGQKKIKKTIEKGGFRY
ncbi:MAG: penicillin-binding protein activator LpoB [Gammaproteobacteria bacterium]|nr:penicillin-binding protein activator LpoB [Gammaproteobacteria bacterium]